MSTCHLVHFQQAWSTFGKMIPRYFNSSIETYCLSLRIFPCVWTVILSNISILFHMKLLEYQEHTLKFYPKPVEVIPRYLSSNKEAYVLSWRYFLVFEYLVSVSNIIILKLNAIIGILITYSKILVLIRQSNLKIFQFKHIKKLLKL